MRHTLLITISIVLLFICSYAQDTIPNQSFESWVTSYHPDNWETTNLLLPLGITNCSQSTNSYLGDYALLLESIDLEGMVVPGVATIGKLELFNTTGGIPYSEKPEALKGFYQHPSSGDEILIGVEFFKDGTAIGGGLWTTTDSVSDYTAFFIPITFNSNQNPDTLNITIVTDQYKAGSSVLVDGLEMEFQTTQINEPDKENIISCYPNPSAGIITFETGHKGDSEIQIYNLDGKLVKEIHTTSKSIKIDLLHCLPGIYFAIVRQGNEVMVEKIILQ